MISTSNPKLFSPLQLGSLQLKHRVVMAPLTRSRSVQPDSVPGNLMRTYYEQRASDGGLIISEATNISLTSRGWLGAPGSVFRRAGQGMAGDHLCGPLKGRAHVRAAVAYRPLVARVDDWRRAAGKRIG